MAANGALTLDDLPLDIPRSKKDVRADERENPRRGAAHRTRSKNGQAGKRRPLARFTRSEDSPSFYLSLSDLMSMLLVFFVLIFSLTEMAPLVNASPAEKAGTAPAVSAAPAAAKAAPATEAAAPVHPPRRMPLPPFLAPVERPGMDGARLVKPVAQSRAQTPPARAASVDPALMTLVTKSSSVAAGNEKRLSELMSSLQKEVKAEAHPRVEVIAKKDRVVLTLPESVSFAVGSAEIKPQANSTLNKLAGVLAKRPGYRVVVTGHTDDVPISNQRFASNWELSAARAAAVARILVQSGLKQSRLSISGLADQAPRVANDTPDHRAKNRRVEIELRKGDA